MTGELCPRLRKHESMGNILLSTVGAKAVSSCLLGRVARVGEGHRMAAKRREWVKREEDRREEARKAHWVANVLERGYSGGGDRSTFNTITVKMTHFQ